MSVTAESFVRDFLAPWNKHDVEGAISMMTPDCVWEYPAGPDPWGNRFSGTAALHRAVANLFEDVPDLHFEVVRYHAGDGHLVIELLVTGTRRDGARLNYQACDVLTLSGSRISAKRSYRKVVS
jgi:ketosteroid isomerase-like protein